MCNWFLGGLMATLGVILALFLVGAAMQIVTVLSNGGGGGGGSSETSGSCAGIPVHGR